MTLISKLSENLKLFIDPNNLLGLAKTLKRVITLPNRYPSMVLLTTGCVIAFQFEPVRSRLSKLITPTVNKLLDSSRKGMGISPAFMRREFRKAQLIPNKPIKDHTHGRCAALRKTANTFITMFASALRLTPYSLQKSKREAGQLGSRIWYWYKDTEVSPTVDRVPNRPIITITDTDYYMDMNYILADYAAPTIISTLQPDSVAKLSSEYTYTFNTSNQIVYNVDGGARYKHKLWDYNHDLLLAQKTFFGIAYKSVIFQVEHKRLDDDHHLVFLAPIGIWQGIPAFLTQLFLTTDNTPRLERLNVYADGFTKLDVRHKSKSHISIGRPGAYSCATLDHGVYDACLCTSNTTSGQMHHGSLQMLLRDKGEDPIHTALLVQYFRQYKNVLPGITRIDLPAEPSVHQYQLEPPTYQPDAQPAVIAYMAPIIDTAYAPMRTLANEKASIMGRVTKPQAKACKAVMTPDIHSYMEEFLENFDYCDNQLASTETVYEIQNRPNQVQILDVPHATTSIKNSYQAVMKAEVYGDPKDPRNISVTDSRLKLIYSRIIYGLKDAMKQRWNAVGMKPREIAERMTMIARNARFIQITDYSRYDGHISIVARELEKRFLTRTFSPELTEVVLAAHEANYNCNGYTRKGHKYIQGTSRASGSPETSTFNTLLNAFVGFMAGRIDGMTTTESWNNLGLYCGDDGVTADISAEAYSKASEKMGLVLKQNTVERGHIGVMFLSRHYSPNIWTGDNTSMTDVPRALRQFTVTPKIDAAPISKLLEKARGYLLTDRQTPILGNFIRKIEQLNGDEILPSEDTMAIRRYTTTEVSEDQYPNEVGYWADEIVARQLREFGFCSDSFEDYLGNATSLEDILRIPACHPHIAPKIKHNVVINGMVHMVPPSVKEIPTQHETSRMIEKDNESKEVKEPEQLDPHIVSTISKMNCDTIRDLQRKKGRCRRKSKSRTTHTWAAKVRD